MFSLNRNLSDNKKKKREALKAVFPQLVTLCFSLELCWARHNPHNSGSRVARDCRDHTWKQNRKSLHQTSVDNQHGNVSSLYFSLSPTAHRPILVLSFPLLLGMPFYREGGIGAAVKTYWRWPAFAEQLILQKKAMVHGERKTQGIFEAKGLSWPKELKGHRKARPIVISGLCHHRDTDTMTRVSAFAFKNSLPALTDTCLAWHWARTC